MAREEGAASDAELDDDIEEAAIFNAAQFLKGVDYPADKAGLLDRARENGADESAIEELEMLPDGQTFDSQMQVFKALGDETQGV